MINQISLKRKDNRSITAGSGRKKFGPKTFQKLLNGETIFVEGLKKKNGEEFDTNLKLDVEEHKIVFVKDEEDDTEEF